MIDKTFRFVHVDLPLGVSVPKPSIIDISSLNCITVVFFQTYGIAL